MATGTDFGDILTAAIHGGYVAHLTDQTYTINSPIVIFVDSTIQGALGIDGGGATLVSQVTHGSPLIQIVVGPGVDFRYLTLSNFTLLGNGSEGNGIEIIADGNDGWAYNWTISGVTVQGVGGYGLDVEGSAFEGLVSNSWMNGNALGGAYFSHSSDGGVASALRWFGGGAQDNGGVGVTLDNGARDLGVEGALFANNDGPGISALSGITAVSNSTSRTISVPASNSRTTATSAATSSRAPERRPSASTAFSQGRRPSWATPAATPAPPPTLADLQGSGALFLTDNNGEVVSGPNLAPNAMGGDMTQVTPGTTGVALPTLAAITAGTTAAKASSTGTGTVESALRAAITGGCGPSDGGHLHRRHADRHQRHQLDPRSGRHRSRRRQDHLADRRRLAGHRDHRRAGRRSGGLTLSNFTIWGNGQEGDGIKIVADGADRSVRDFTISNVNVEHVGGIGLDVLGNVSQGTVFNSWMHGDAEGGARFANSAGGGVVSALEWMGGGVRKNGVAGLILDNGARDLSVTGAYFVDNDGPGLRRLGHHVGASSGFENNLGSGAIVLGPASFADDTFATYGRQATAIGGYLAGGQVVLTGVGNEYYGPGADPTVLANLQGQGILAIAGAGNVMVGPNVAVTGALTGEIETFGSTALVQITGNYFIDGTTGPELSYTARPSRQGSSARGCRSPWNRGPTATKSPGRGAPMSICCGSSTAMATGCRKARWCPGRARRCSRSSPVSIRTSTATARSHRRR